MSLYRVLESEYRYILELFERLRTTTGRIGATRQRLLQLLSREVTTLIQAEEEVVYAALQDVLPEDDDSIFDLMEEHADLRGRLWELEQLRVHDPGWLPRLESAAEVARQLVNLERSCVYDTARTLLAPEVASALAERLLLRKAEIGMVAKEIETPAAGDRWSSRGGSLLN